MDAHNWKHFVRDSRTLETVHLADGKIDIRFHINPDTFRAESEFLHNDVQTRSGFCRFNYGVKPTIYTLQGFTGTAGLDGKGGLQDLENFRPQPGRPNKILLFRYPARFRGVRFVYLNKFEDSMDSGMHLYNQYSIELVEYGQKAQTPPIRIAGNPAGVSLYIYG